MTALESLIEATNAFKNFRAILLLGMALVGAALVTALFGVLANSLGSIAFGGLGALLGFLVIFYGVNAVGIMMMREAQGQPMNTIMDAVLVSLFTSHRFIAVVVLEFLIVLAAVIVIAAILFVCKIPAIGPFLFTFAFPFAAIFLGILIFALFYIMLPLAGPAVWSGSTVFQVIARMNMIVRNKLVSVILLEVLLFFITIFTATLIFTIVFTGVMVTSGLSASILGMQGIGMGNMMAIFSSISGSGYMLAASIGGGLLLAVAAVIPGLIFTKGICIIYLDSIKDLDFSQSEASLDQGLASVKKKAEEARNRARVLAEKSLSKPHTPPVNPMQESAYSAETTQVCPACKDAVSADDMFCGNCSHKLK